jgi:hypothetical protein
LLGASDGCSSRIGLAETDGLWYIKDGVSVCCCRCSHVAVMLCLMVRIMAVCRSRAGLFGHDESVLRSFLILKLVKWFDYGT